MHPSPEQMNKAAVDTHWLNTLMHCIEVPVNWKFRYLLINDKQFAPKLCTISKTNAFACRVNIRQLNLISAKSSVSMYMNVSKSMVPLYVVGMAASGSVNRYKRVYVANGTLDWRRHTVPTRSMNRCQYKYNIWVSSVNEIAILDRTV